MIEYFSTDPTTRSLTKLDAEQPGCWIALFEPTDGELDAMAARFHIDPDDIRAPLDLEEVSRIETDDDYTMFIVDTPMHSTAGGEKRYTPIPIGIFETPDHVLTVCSVYRVPIISLLKTKTRGRRDAARTAARAKGGLQTAAGLHDTGDIRGFTGDLLLASSEAYFNSLRALNRRRVSLSNTTEKPSRKDLEELYSLDASLVYIKTSLATNDTVFERYRRYVLASHDPEAIELFDDVIIENRQALETTRIYSEILDSTIEHFGLMMDYDLNRTMQLVATLTLVLCIPTVVGGLFGMNLGGIPLTDSPYGFAVVTGITAIALLVTLAVLKHLKWF